MIAGIVPCSFIDFPKRIAAVLFVQGCNLNCPYCHNPDLVGEAEARLLATDDLRAWLKCRIRRITGVVITGGEPTLQPGLMDLLVAIRSIGYRIKLDTNGTRPTVLRQLLDRSLLDYVAMDLKDLPQNYGSWLSRTDMETAILDSIALLKSSGIRHEFRTTVQHPHHNLETLDGIRKIIGNDAHWYLQCANDEVPFRQQGLHCMSQSHIDSMVSELRHRGARDVFARGSRPSLRREVNHGNQRASALLGRSQALESNCCRLGQFAQYVGK